MAQYYLIFFFPVIFELAPAIQTLNFLIFISSICEQRKSGSRLTLIMAEKPKLNSLPCVGFCMPNLLSFLYVSVEFFFWDLAAILL